MGYSPWGHRKSDTTEHALWSDLSRVSTKCPQMMTEGSPLQLAFLLCVNSPDPPLSSNRLTSTIKTRRLKEHHVNGISQSIRNGQIVKSSKFKFVNSANKSHWKKNGVSDASSYTKTRTNSPTTRAQQMQRQAGLTPPPGQDFPEVDCHPLGGKNIEPRTATPPRAQVSH